VKLQGKVAVVTGAACGIGRAIATAFLEEGARTALADIDRAALRKTNRGLAGLTANALAIRGDATRADDVSEMIATTVRQWGRIDILVNNVGGSVGDGSLDGPEEDWDATLALCFKSQFLFCRAVAPLMRGQKSGRIINMSSNAGKYRSNTGVSSISYSAAKAAVLQLTRSAAHALGPFGITVNAIAPGSVLSEAGVREFAALAPELRERVLRETPLGYFADPREIASIAVFLASEDASYITGATIVANGGWCTT
jgi:NAD(P)-dependent dehydrogenase (short-subunit alcohol dehydrogenase family)